MRGWDEQEHPRGQDGRWVERLSARLSRVWGDAGVVFDDDEYMMDDDNEGDFFVGLSPMFFGEQIQWRPKVPKPEGAR